MKHTHLKTTKKINARVQVLGANAVEYALVMAIIVGMMITASQMMRPGIDGLFTDTGERMRQMVNGASSGGSGAQNSNSANSQSDDGGGSFLGSVWNGAVSTVSFGGNVIYGAGEGIWDLGSGVVTLGYDVVRMPFNGDVRSQYADAGRAIWNDPSLIVDAFVDPITDDWNNGNRGQAIGRGIFEVASLFVAPTKIGKAGKLDDIADVARVADDAADVARIADDAADVARVADGFYDPRAWRQNYEDFYNGNITSTTVPPYSAKNVHLAGKRHPVTGIVYDQRGFPIFDDVAQFDTRLPTSEFRNASYETQMRMATRDLRSTLDSNPQLRSQFDSDQLASIQAGNKKIPGYTWHHHQDTGRMQLVPSDIHSRTGHIGGEAMAIGE